LPPIFFPSSPIATAEFYTLSLHDALPIWVRIPLGSHWLMLVITGVLFVLVATFVDLKPVVDQNFFFSTNDPGILQTKKIERRFPDRKSTRLNSSHVAISYAVFCLKKKKK